MKFTIDDIKDKELLNRLIQEETDRIYNSPTARKGRSRDHIEAMVMQGKTAEVYLVETGKYDFADLKWHDVKSKHNGVYCEVKAYEAVETGFARKNPNVQRELERIAKENWNKSEFLIVFKYTAGEYELADVIGIERITNLSELAEQIVEICKGDSKNDFIFARDKVKNFLLDMGVTFPAMSKDC